MKIRSVDWLTMLLLTMAAFCVFGAVMSVRQGVAYEDACRARGGVPVLAKHSRICLDPEAFKR